MAVCINCGEPLGKAAKFCPNCGKAVEKRTSEGKSGPTQTFEGEIKRCPNCGESVPSFNAVCANCGFEFRNTKASTAVQDFAEMIAKIEYERRNSSDSAMKMLIKRFDRKKGEMDITDKSIANIIRSFAVPNTIEDIFEFMALASSNIDLNVLNKPANTPEEKANKAIVEAWSAKFEQVYRKAQITFGQSDDFYQIQEIYNAKQNEKIEREAKKKEESKQIFLWVVGILFVLWVLGTITSIVDAHEQKQAQNAGKVNPPISSSEIGSQNYKTLLSQFESAGFMNISTEKIEDLVTGWLTKDGEVEEIQIGEKTRFSKSDYFSPRTEVIIRYHTFPESIQSNTPSSFSEKSDSSTSSSQSQTTVKSSNSNEKTSRSVTYSTNDAETAKEGNSGVFSYKSAGGTYDNYWIIDFDEEYVYFFSEGNSDSTCDRLKIDSGDLNSVLIITYHDGDDMWSYGLHFKWKNQPTTLILQDEIGFEYSYVTTDLEDALKIRDSKTISDY